MPPEQKAARSNRAGCGCLLYEMTEINNNITKRKRVRFSTEIMFILSVVFCIGLSWIYLARYNDILSLQQTEQEQKERIEDLERENRMLKDNLEMLNSRRYRTTCKRTFRSRKTRRSCCLYNRRQKRTYNSF